MSHSGSSGVGPPGGEAGRSRHPQYAYGPYHTGDGAERHQGRSQNVEQHYYAPRGGEREELRRTVSGKYPEEYKKNANDKGKQGRQSYTDGRPPPEGGGRVGGGGSRYVDTYSSSRSAQPKVEGPYAPTTGQIRSGHLELDSLYSGESGSVQVNSMNAPNNSTVQCGCENIDCPFCNQMMSIQMTE